MIDESTAVTSTILSVDNENRVVRRVDGQSTHYYLEVKKQDAIGCDYWAPIENTDPGNHSVSCQVDRMAMWLALKCLDDRITRLDEQYRNAQKARPNLDKILPKKKDVRVKATPTPVHEIDDEDEDGGFKGAWP